MKPVTLLPYELAVIAKQKGFNEPCLNTFNDVGLPTYPQIEGWLLYNHKKPIFIDFIPKKSYYFKNTDMGCVIDRVDKEAEDYNVDMVLKLKNDAIKEALTLIF